MAMTLSDMLSALKVAHAAIITDIDRILENARDYRKAYGCLREFEQVFGEYSKLQNNAFYEQVLSECTCNPKVIEVLQDDLTGLKVDFLEFMDQYTSNASLVQERNFPRDFLLLSRRIIERLSLEEDQLFPILNDPNKIID